MLSPIPLLSSEKTQEILAKIDQLRPFWTKRQNRFYTLGTAIYLDKNNDSPFYENSVEANNFFLKIHFSHLYALLLESLKKELNQEVVYEPARALPGFHIFLSDPEFVTRGGKIHFDLQFQQIDWRHYKNIDLSNPLSFTLALALPKLGGGLFYWDKKYEPGSKMIPEEAIQDLPRHYVEYETGKMVLHNGLLIHQIAPAKEYLEEDRRITLQGHALFCDGAWRVYW
ncbi:conserved hypothetical protein [Candidatus Protochlamydia naegleriophila]|uniref:Fe2OG dioxygenase domain-containing protein n=1 Tax=Candidatus Protochlamydia naegleriophila TaxID=389348 RepID=A0A0U5JD34_9BACT|nr:hypothetical protein [Candidatus Protochlamydia naegleriophila]CUI17784.1 conserved hypothetical protein [Candidatus Protochlamydia naegleriophila]